ncbi:DUF6773 family protein [Clostridium tarantellae]|uniref:Uncharacterized protein n=1 Tax=Clostridium tarantellae TaxID=39493 RepID=A0A6I1MQE6_9CLOT|nr:DUF6773 family protein [Clostridium tarantellae]MPQ45010.1 hypothetical protein [Clostridium tarantellae]
MKFHNEEERVDKELHHVYFDGYLILQALALITLTLKMYLININILSISPELLILVGGNSYIFIRTLFLRVNLIDFFKGRDEFNLTYRNKIFYEAFYIEFIGLLVMMAILALMINRGILRNEAFLLSFFNIEIFIPCAYVTYKSMKKGLLISRVSKNKQKVRKILGSVIGAVLFILLNNWNRIISGEVLTNRDIIFILKDIILWVIFVIIPLNLISKKSEKNADKLAN